VESVLISVGKKELEEIRADEKNFQVECQFCDTVYEFTPADIDEILKNI
jgi:molecular chaperone Hsp33